jgi:hypothetical protein
MENNIELVFHEIILLTLNQLIRLSPVRVKEICSSVNGFMQALILLRDSYSNQANHQARYYIFLIHICTQISSIVVL